MQDVSWTERLEDLRGALHLQALRKVRNEAEAQDLVQEVFVRCVDQRPDTLRPLLPYASKILENLLFNRWRNEGRTIPLDDVVDAQELEEPRRMDELDPLLRLDPGFDDVEQKDFFELLGRRLGSLPRPLREVCKRRWFEDQDYRRIAGDLGLDEATVRVRYFKARRLLALDRSIRAALLRDACPPSVPDRSLPEGSWQVGGASARRRPTGAVTAGRASSDAPVPAT